MSLTGIGIDVKPVQKQPEPAVTEAGYVDYEDEVADEETH